MSKLTKNQKLVAGKIEAGKAYSLAVQKMLDKLAKTNIIHKNKASNIKSSIMLHVSKLA